MRNESEDSPPDETKFPSRRLIWIALGLGAAVVACMLLAPGRRSPPANARAISTALFELHESVATNTNRALWFRSLPASIKALGGNGEAEVNNIEMGSTHYAITLGHRLWGFKWSRRFELSRSNTNDTVWTLSQGYSIVLPGLHEKHWQRPVATFTNTP